jgi:hypothetical protein
MEAPKELELPNPNWPDPAELAREIEKCICETSHPGLAKQDAQMVVAIPPTFAKATIAVATNVWRLRARLIDRHSGEIREDVSREDVKKMTRYIEAIYEAFSEIGVEIKDRTGETFDYGLPEKVVTTQPQEGLSRERIIETLRPTIYWKDKLAQQGEVIIATPIASAWEEST